MNQIIELSEENLDLEKQLSIKNKTVAELKSRNKSLVRDQHILRGKLEKAEVDRAIYKKQFENASHKHDVVLNQLEMWRRESKSLFVEKNKKITAVTQELTDKDALAESLKREVHHLTKQVEGLKRQVKDRRDMEQVISDLKLSNATLESQINPLAERVATRNNSLKKSHKAMQTLARQLKELKLAKANVEADRDKLAKKVDTLGFEATRVGLRTQKFKKLVAERDTLLKEANERVDALTKDIEDLTNNLSAAQVQAKTLKQLAAESEAQLAVSNKRVEASAINVSLLEQSLEQKQQRITVQDSQIKEYDKRLAQLKVSGEKSKVQIADLEDALSKSGDASHTKLLELLVRRVEALEKTKAKPPSTEELELKRGKMKIIKDIIKRRKI